MSSPISDMSDPPSPPRQRPTASDDEDDALSDSPPPKPAAKPLEDIFSDDDEDVAPKPRARRPASPKGSDDELKDDDDKDPSDLENDLFGSDEEMGDAEPSRKVRTLDDEELDSGDDLDADPRRRRGDRIDDLDDDLDELERDETSYEVDIGLHQLPQSSNDETYLLKIPQFISIAPQIFKPETFQAPKLPPDAAITPYTFATTAIRWRKSLKDPSKLESNSRIIEWSDGSFSLQIGSSKEGLYDLPTNPLVSSKDKEYNPAHDSFTFLAEPLANSRLVRFFSHASQSMGVVPAVDNVITDDIKQMVAARYKATQKRRVDDGMKQMELSYKIEDPEKARREAEALEREAERFRKKAEAALRNKEAEGANGYTRRSRKAFGGGLNAGDLEEERYDRKGRGGSGYGKKYQEDEYDDGDDFIEPDPPSDEEEDIIDDSEEEEEYESSRRKEKKKKKDRKKEKRRARDEEEEDSEPEAEFTDDEEEPRERAKSPGKKARSASVADEDEDEGEHMKAPDRKRRKVVMEDSEEE
ncbi:hypothetical protein TWF694_003590 [Orbilia ellipsospora]|uniref:RNA polymerase-associated protein LEO1 n=1 Tax=Orbilia ellipsospora TaxID=2528407 RepID=A0AAV9X0W1_9PEZI